MKREGKGGEEKVGEGEGKQRKGGRGGGEEKGRDWPSHLFEPSAAYGPVPLFMQEVKQVAIFTVNYKDPYVCW
jgi:hypothetical protein